MAPTKKLKPDMENVLEAFAEIRNGISLRKAATKYGIPRTTLQQAILRLQRIEPQEMRVVHKGNF